VSQPPRLRIFVQRSLAFLQASLALVEPLRHERARAAERLMRTAAKSRDELVLLREQLADQYGARIRPYE